MLIILEVLQPQERANVLSCIQPVYLKLILGGNSAVAGFSVADWASHLHRHWISGFAYFVGLGAVSWSTKKQSIITLSSTEAEYVALTHAAKNIIWIHKLLTDLSFLHSLSLPTTLYCDNQGAIHLSKNATFHGRTKHIDVHFHFIRQTVSSGAISLIYIPTGKMTADIFTIQRPSTASNLNVSAPIWTLRSVHNEGECYLFCYSHLHRLPYADYFLLWTTISSYAVLPFSILHSQPPTSVHSTTEV